MYVVIICVCLGLAAGTIAQNKGRNFLGYFILGTLIPVVGLVIALAVAPDTAGVEARELASGNAVKCPHCAELIRPEASVCRFCGRDAVDSQIAPDRDWQASEAATRTERSYWS